MAAVLKNTAFCSLNNRLFHLGNNMNRIGHAFRRYKFKMPSPSTTSMPQIQINVGDHLPDVELFENSPNDAILASDLYKGKNGILFAVVGAFTPGCTFTHIPDYLSLYEKFKNEGFMVSCVSVNDPFVMSAWGKHTKADGKIRMLADPKGKFTQALGMELDCKNLLGGVRSQKYSLVIVDGVVQSINVDPEHTGLACLLCIKTVAAVK